MNSISKREEGEQIFRAFIWKCSSTYLSTVTKVEEKQTAGTTSDVANSTTGYISAAHDFKFSETWAALRYSRQTFVTYRAPGNIQMGQSLAGTKI